MAMTWSRLTESNRRPSPYHFLLQYSVIAGQAADLQDTSAHERSLASGRLTQAPIATQTDTQNDLTPPAALAALQQRMRMQFPGHDIARRQPANACPPGYCP